MKRLVVILGGLLALPAFAEVAPFYDTDVAEFADTEIADGGDAVADEIIAEKSAPQAPIIQARPGARASATRSVSRAMPSNVTTGNRVQNSRVVASRGTTGATTARGTTSRATVARSAGTTNAARATTQLRSTGSNNALYLESGTNTGRVSVRPAQRSAIGAVSVSNTTTATSESIKAATESMDNLMELTDYCKAQYTACMDNFCNVLDDNQGRCSCSKNLKNYEKTEEALRSATEELQEVAQRIQYIGLTADEITTLFTQTEAEVAMQNTSDSTKLKNDLDRIKNMIVGVKSGSASAIGDSSGISLDLSNLLSFSFDSNGFDLSAIFGTTSSNTSSVSNQRGEALYKTAAARCKSAVLNQCTSQGVDAAVITNSYDVEIDKQCIVYERNLTDSNSQMTATVRNAKTVLQKARLMVAQQKNQYDLRGCISALDSCMQDDYVCGTDYEDCLDPTGKYIVDGKVVTGSLPGLPGGMWGTEGTATSAEEGLYTVWNRNGNGNNIWAPGSTSYQLSQYIDETVKPNSAKLANSSEIAIYLQNKLGYNENGKNYGMCISILNKCQDYTYEKGSYKPDNAVIKNFMQRALRQIKSGQDEVISNYASSCISDVTSCLSQNNYNSSGSSMVAVAACLPVINTCRSVTLGADEANVPDDVLEWLNDATNSGYLVGQTACEESHGSWNSTARACMCNASTTGLEEVTESDKVVSCKCPDAKPNWNGSKCISDAEQDCTDTGGTYASDACTCGTSKPKLNGTKCEACGEGTEWDGSDCVTQ